VFTLAVTTVTVDPDIDSYTIRQLRQEDVHHMQCCLT
jgi:hypothetical protein